MIGSIQTERLLLRKWKKSDFADFMEFACDPAVMLPGGSEPLQTKQPRRAAVYFDACRQQGECYAVTLRDSGKVIGSVTLSADNRRFRIRSFSVGYLLNRHYWGQGYMTEAFSAVIRRMFEYQNCEALSISHFEGNDRSRRVIEKCGFRPEGVTVKAFRRCDGAVLDEYCYGLLREEYFAAKENAKPAGVNYGLSWQENMKRL